MHRFCINQMQILQLAKTPGIEQNKEDESALINYIFRTTVSQLIKVGEGENPSLLQLLQQPAPN